MGGKTLSTGSYPEERRRPAAGVGRPAAHSAVHGSHRPGSFMPGCRSILLGNASLILLAIVLTAASPPAQADGPGRIYAKALGTDSGVIAGKVKGAVLTHALVVERDRSRVYLAALEAGGTGFRFANLPVGRFDLVLVTQDGRVLEGLGLGAAAALPEDRAKHLEAGVTKADSFFNRRICHRCGIDDGTALVFVERIRDGQILRGSGEELNAGLRRLELIELREAADEWQMVRTRHLYREEIPRQQGLPFFTHRHLPALGGLRVAAAPRDLGTLDLTQG